MKEIIIEVAPNGQVTIEAVGFKGKSCDAATAAFEDALGTVSDKKKKPEYHNDALETGLN
jgi:hypothetical protein